MSRIIYIPYITTYIFILSLRWQPHPSVVEMRREMARIGVAQAAPVGEPVVNRHFTRDPANECNRDLSTPIAHRQRLSILRNDFHSIFLYLGSYTRSPHSVFPFPAWAMKRMSYTLSRQRMALTAGALLGSRQISAPGIRKRKSQRDVGIFFPRDLHIGVDKIIQRRPILWRTQM